MYDNARLLNVKQCFSVNDQKPGWGIRWGYGRGGEPNSAPIPPFQGRPRMKTDIESQISYQRETLQHLKRELNELERHYRDLQTNVTRCEQAVVRNRRQHTTLQVEMQQAEETVEKLQESLEQESVEEGRLDALKAYLRETQEEKAIHEGSYEESVNAIDKSNETLKDVREQLQAKGQTLVESEAKVKRLEAKALKLSTQRQAALHEKNSAIQRIEDAKQDKGMIENKQQAMLARVKDFTEKASKVSPRVPVDAGETTDSLEKKLDKLNGDLAKYQRQIGGDRKEIAEQAAAAFVAWKTAKEQVVHLEELAQLLKAALIDRQDRWRKFRRYISARARSQFTYLLSERSFRGSLKTDHRRRILELHVEPDETKTGKGRITKTLSGGEKSFSTICLLLSLWEAMGSPIRCLDEFDVFMDNVNRDVSMRMMIVAARRSVGRQYILITPQSMGNVDVAADVKIIK
ncbi:MAG: Structural maintenance of chromosomes protein 6 [Pleopsidium flavum]|nr:MAG: Structural maintenance of chromosomes protein 6 [Pleopsidium flavum]